MVHYLHFYSEKFHILILFLLIQGFFKINFMKKTKMITPGILFLKTAVFQPMVKTAGKNYGHGQLDSLLKARQLRYFDIIILNVTKKSIFFNG